MKRPSRFNGGTSKVASNVKPAEDCNKGLLGSDLTPKHRWKRGPEFLRRDTEMLPQPQTFGMPQPEDPKNLILSEDP